MANVTLLSKVVLRNATEAEWITNSSKILLKGEIGLSLSEATGLVKELKIGDGISTWGNLPSESLVLQGNSAPTSSVKGSLGQVYVVNSAGSVSMYQCTAISGTTYTWTKNEGKSYTLSSESDTASANILLTGSDESIGSVNLRGTGSVTVSKDATGILLTGVDNDTKIANLTKDAGKVVTGAVSGTTLQTTPVEDLELDGYSKTADTGSISVGDTLEKAFSKLENELANLDIIDALAVDNSKIIVGYDSSEETQWSRISAISLLLSGYTKSTDAGSIVSTDTLLKALSKLENALADLADGMVYSGAISGGSTGAYGALTPAAEKGNTYKVNATGKINGVSVHIGDLIICNMDSTVAATSDNYATIAGKWDVFSFDSSLNVSASSTMAANQLVIGDSGSRDLKSFPIGSNNQVLGVVNNKPAWIDNIENDTYIDTINSSDGISASLTMGNTELNIGITSISTDLFSQGSNTLILNGGNSVTP